VRFLRLPNGDPIPALGLGTWGMGERGSDDDAALEALCLGLDLGLGLVDTAEMYGDGGAETLVGRAIAGRRDEVFLVSKVLPQNATRRGTIAACERSLRRLGTDHLDLYLLHWRGSVPLEETVAGLLALHEAGKIRHWGVSNFDPADMAMLWALPAGGGAATNQVLYNLMRRGIEWDLLPACRDRRLPIMAYSPFEQGRLLKKAEVRRLAQARGVSPAQFALAWLLRQDGVIPIPKAGRTEHIREIRAALDLALSPEEMTMLDRVFPPPDGPRPLEML
jgi:diketogulonate reductase-like aldo/keto reductase